MLVLHGCLRQARGRGARTLAHLIGPLRSLFRVFLKADHRTSGVEKVRRWIAPARGVRCTTFLLRVALLVHILIGRAFGAFLCVAFARTTDDLLLVTARVLHDLCSTASIAVGTGARVLLLVFILVRIIVGLVEATAIPLLVFILVVVRIISKLLALLRLVWHRLAARRGCSALGSERPVMIRAARVLLILIAQVVVAGNGRHAGWSVWPLAKIQFF